MSAGPVASPPHWARIQLVQGSSRAGLWDLSSELPEARLSVGSAPNMNWVIERVAPHHFDLFWDGQCLWVSPPGGGDVRVDGERVTAWRQLVGRSRLEFGGAAMLVETSASIAASGAHSGGALAYDTSDVLEDSALLVPMDSGTMPLEDIEPIQELEADATKMLDVGAMGAPSPFGKASPFDKPPSTQIFDPAAAGIMMPASRPPPDLGAPPVYAAPAAPAPAPTPAPAPSPAPSTPAAPAEGPPTSAPLPAETPATNTSRFAPPPPPATDEAKRKLELPPKRTLILAGFAFVVSIGFLTMTAVRKNRREAAAIAARAEALELDRERARVAAEEQGAAVQARIAAEQEAEVRLRARVGAELAALSESVETEKRAELEAAYDAGEIDEGEIDVQVSAAVRRRQQLRAAELLARNSFREAFGAYLHLANAHPEVSEYGRLASILRERLRCEGDACE